MYLMYIKDNIKTSLSSTNSGKLVVVSSNVVDREKGLWFEYNKVCSKVQEVLVLLHETHNHYHYYKYNSSALT